MPPIVTKISLRKGTRRIASWCPRRWLTSHVVDSRHLPPPSQASDNSVTHVTLHSAVLVRLQGDHASPYKYWRMIPLLF